MLRITNLIRRNHTADVLDVIVGRMNLIVTVPDTNHVEPTLGANSNTQELISGVLCDGTKHYTNAVLHEHVGCILARNAHTVGAAADICRILPHRRNRVLHKAEEAIQKCVVTEGVHERPELRPSAHRHNRLICGEGPASLMWRVVPKSPCTTGNGIIGH